jgi:predicted nucleotide-binding protein
MNATSFEVPVQIVLQAANKALAAAKKAQQQERNRQIQDALHFGWFKRFSIFESLKPVTQAQAEQHADRPNSQRAFSEEPRWDNKHFAIEDWANQLIDAANISRDKCGSCRLSPEDAQAVTTWLKHNESKD